MAACPRAVVKGLEGARGRRPSRGRALVHPGGPFPAVRRFGARVIRGIRSFPPRADPRTARLNRKQPIDAAVDATNYVLWIWASRSTPSTSTSSTAGDRRAQGASRRKARHAGRSRKDARSRGRRRRRRGARGGAGRHHGRTRHGGFNRHEERPPGGGVVGPPSVRRTSRRSECHRLVPRSNEARPEAIRKLSTWRRRFSSRPRVGPWRRFLDVRGRPPFAAGGPSPRPPPLLSGDSRLDLTSRRRLSPASLRIGTKSAKR